MKIEVNREALLDLLDGVRESMECIYCPCEYTCTGDPAKCREKLLEFLTKEA